MASTVRLQERTLLWVQLDKLDCEVTINYTSISSMSVKAHYQPLEAG